MRSNMSGSSRGRSNMSGSSRGRSNMSGSSRGESFDFAVSNMTAKNGNSLEYSQTAEDLPDVSANASQPAPAAKSYDRKIQEQQLSNLFLEQQQFRQQQQQQQQQEQVSQQQQQQKTNRLSATVSDGSLDLEDQLTMSDELTDELLDTDLGMTIDKTGVVSASETSDSIYMDPNDVKGNPDRCVIQ